MRAEPVTYRRMRPQDLDACLELKELAGWNQLRRDWELFIEFNPAGCFVACAADRVVGTVTTMDYGGRVSWIGMVLVHPDFRRRGIGTGLLEAAIEALEDCNTIKLDATPVGKTLYDGLGFHDEYKLARMTIPSLDLNQSDQYDATQMQPMPKSMLPDVIAFDSPRFGADRGTVLQAWHQRKPEAAFVVHKNSSLEGYSMGRPGANFATIGPVVAENENIARQLVLATAQAFPKQPLCIDILMHTESFQTWLQTLGFTMQRPFIRMARGPNAYPGHPPDIWAALGPELG